MAMSEEPSAAAAAAATASAGASTCASVRRVLHQPSGCSLAPTRGLESRL